MKYEHLLAAIAKKDERLIVMTAENRAAIRNLPELLGDRFLDTGITEQTLIGASAGLALRGRIPVVHALASFLTMRAFEFIRTDIGISHAPVKLVGFVPGFLSTANGPTHQAIEDISLMRGIPGMRIFCPADNTELINGLEEIILDEHPWYIRYNETEAITKHSKFAIGKAETFFDGKDVCILTYGFMLNEVYKAAQILIEKGVKVRVVNLRCLEPIDEETIVREISLCDYTVTVEDHFMRGGLYTSLAEICLTRGINLSVLPIALENKWFKPALLDEIMRYEGFNAQSISDRIINFCNANDDLKEVKRIVAGI